MKRKIELTRRRTAKLKKPQQPAPSRQPGGTFPIVGLGASAGGLEALEQFLKHLPPESGLAFVIVQHLDPTHKGILPELLQRSTTMKVIQVKDRLKVRPNCVYVIPPNKDMSLLRGVLHLFEPTAPRGMRLPIDFFFRSLAEDQRERSVGVILSGMGSDGTQGIKAIKEQAGVVLVQEPASAKFDGMPRSAIDAGMVDIVASAEELPGKLLKYLQHVPLVSGAEKRTESSTASHLEKIVILLRSQTGHDFSLYKHNTLYRRIERRMALHQISKIGTYVRYLRENPAELNLLFKELLIGVTSFFRDSDAWKQLRDDVVPSLLASRAAGQTLRAWVPGCSTGEEAYSLAIVFKEALEQIKPHPNLSVQIFATDLDREAVDKARLGFFPANISADVSPERLRRHFIKEERGYRISKEIREMVIFAPQNLIMDPPFTKLDILSCRNLLIYLAPELQKKLLPLFHYGLNPGGILFLGSAESVAGFTELFEPFPGKSRLFRSKECKRLGEMVEFPAAFVAPSPNSTNSPHAPVVPPASLQSLAERWLLQHHAPAAVLVNDQGDILFISGRTGRYLEPAMGKANWNVFVMAREGLRYELAGLFQRARRQKGAAAVRGLKVAADGGTNFVDLAVEFIDQPGELRGLAMIVLTEQSMPHGEGKRKSVKALPQYKHVQELEQELQQTREEAQSTREEMQTSQEELKSMNEELQSTNEELQSTNEELTTSKEEMQSLNEELQTVNCELQAKVDELSAASNDMKNLLNSTEIATVFLDGALRVRRFTDKATHIFKFIPGDVGRPVTDLASELEYPTLADDTRDVLRTLVPLEKPVVARGKRWYAMRMMPYRTVDDRIDGVVITFTDMSLAKKFEAEVLAAEKTEGSAVK